MPRKKKIKYDEVNEISSRDPSNKEITFLDDSLSTVKKEIDALDELLDDLANWKKQDGETNDDFVKKIKARAEIVKIKIEYLETYSVLIGLVDYYKKVNQKVEFRKGYENQSGAQDVIKKAIELGLKNVGLK